MNISFKNLGFIKRGELKTNDLTVIFGPNNVGKTYLSYTIYAALLENKRKFSSIGVVTESLINDLMENGAVESNIWELYKLPDTQEFSNTLTKELPKFFKDISGLLSNAHISVNSDLDIYPAIEKKFSWILKASDNVSLRVSKKERSETVKFDLLEMSNDGSKPVSEHHITKNEMLENVMFLINHIGTENVFCNITKTPFIITSERTGISLFLKEIDKNRNEIVNEIAFQSASKINNKQIKNIFNQRVSKFSEPINNNINLIRNSLNRFDFDDENSSDGKESILEALNGLIGGEYSVNKDEIMFTPHNISEEIKIPISLVSGAGKSLFLFDLYVKQYLDKDSFLIIDEPELNLHPNNQIKMAKLLVRLANYGVKIIITTHSDYLVKELNNRIMAKELNDSDLNEKIGYSDCDLISQDKVNAFTITETGVVHEVDKSKFGISSSLFDSAITDVDTRAETLIYRILEGSDD